MIAEEYRRTTVLPVNSVSPDPAILTRAGLILQEGGLVAFPTETVYGLGANALDANAVLGIYRAKGRPSRNPLIVHFVGTPMRELLISEWPPMAELLAKTFWPGPLTIVLAKNSLVPDVVTGGGPTVAIREPAHPIARALIQAADRPIAAPSANRSNEISPTLAEHVSRGLEGRIDLILDGGPCVAGIESTVVDLSGQAPRLLRPGPISLEMLEKCIGPVEMSSGHLDSQVLPSPGMLAKHYSPRTPTVMRLDPPGNDDPPIRRAILSSRVLPESFDNVWLLPNDPVAYATEIYAKLHEVDALGFDQIVIIEPPRTPEWAAVLDRLTRATHES